MKHDMQPQTEYGFIDMHGHKWCNAWVDTYNRFTDKVNKSAGVELHAGSLAANEREFYLDQRHKTFVQFINIKRESNQARMLT